MSRTGWLVLLLVLSLGQLYWLVSTWRRDGFAAAFKLFAYGCISGFLVLMQYELDL